ncbi:MAG: hypothetical protein JKY93_02160 [Gammaproteobacteria bacterium]|nr:hypothetical protein [Gammaproteobacteria bacterium]
MNDKISSDRATFTYTEDMPRPSCPECGLPVEPPDGDPQLEWAGTCLNGHENTYQLDV